MGELKWYFSKDSSEKLILNETQSEIFKNSKEAKSFYETFAREIIQNSIDAKKDNAVKTIVKFSFAEINIEDFPDVENLRKHFEGTKRFCEENEKKCKALNKAISNLKVLEQNKIRLLKASDFETKGVTGSDDPTNPKSYWRGLVFNDGDSNKYGNSSLGSHGLGKNAAFSISKFSTVFYVTKDINNVYAMQGVTKQATSFDENNNKLYNEGYFCNFENHPLPLNEEQAKSISNVFERTENGTDIIVCEPYVYDESIQKSEATIMLSIIKNYYVAILEGQLEIHVGKEIINEKTLRFCFSRLTDYADIISNNEKKQIEECLDTYENGQTIKFDIKNYGEIELKLLKTENSKNKNVYIFRKRGMLIKEKSINTAQQKFTGVLIVKGDRINSLLSEIENPTHNDFDYTRPRSKEFRDLSDNDVKKILEEFYEKIKLHCEKFTKLEHKDTMFLVGMEKYISTIEDGQETMKAELKKSSKNIKQTKVREVSIEEMFKKGPFKNEGKEEFEKIEITHSEDDTEKSEKKEKVVKDSNIEEQENPVRSGLINKQEARFIIRPTIKYDDNNVTLIFKPAQTDKNLNIEINAIDEDGKINNFLPNIVSVKSLTTENQDIKYGNLIISNITAKDITKLKIEFSYQLRCRLAIYVYWEELA